MTIPDGKSNVRVNERLAENGRLSRSGRSSGVFNARPAHSLSPKEKLTMVRMYRIYASGTGTASAVASITIPRGGIIGSVQWACVGVSGSVATQMLCELSTSSVTTATQNDTPGNSISTFVSPSNGISGGGMGGDLCHLGLGVPIEAGEKLYVHFALTGGAPASFQVIATIAIAH